MRTFTPKPSQSQKPASSKLVRPNIIVSKPNHDLQAVSNLQRMLGDQAGRQGIIRRIHRESCPKTSSRFAHDFSRIPVHSKKSAQIQPKLTVSTTGDRYEQEADRVAEEVMRDAPSARTRVQRYPAPTGFSDSHLSPTLSRRIEGMAGQGQPLSTPVQRFFERRLGTDLGGVRIHTGGATAQTARALNADAYTFGQEIAFASGRYNPVSAAGGHLLAHELAHVAQQRDRIRRVQRAQIGRVHTPASGTPHFLYELDTTMSRLAQLASYYGVTTAQILAKNPGVSPTALRFGQQIKVPAFNPPTGPAPVGPPAPGLIQSTGTVPIPVRWNTGGNDNQIGRTPRGTSAGMVGDTLIMNLAGLRNVAQGVVGELRLRKLTKNGDVYGYAPAANVRSTLGPTAATDVDLIARMIWGEQRSQGDDAMAAAAWVAKNRYNAGWGSYSQIITQPQFHGLARPDAVKALTRPRRRSVDAGTEHRPGRGGRYHRRPHWRCPVFRQ